MLTAEDVKSLLTNLAVKRQVAAFTQDQAFNALLFLYRYVLLSAHNPSEAAEKGIT